MTYYELQIAMEGQANPRAEDRECFDIDIEKYPSFSDVRKAITIHYGKDLLKHFKKYRPIFRDIKGKSKQVGISYSFWNRDISHNSKSWWQTDWITIDKVDENREAILNKKFKIRGN